MEAGCKMCAFCPSTYLTGSGEDIPDSHVITQGNLDVLVIGHVYLCHGNKCSRPDRHVYWYFNAK